MRYKINILIYGIAAIAGSINSFISFRSGNQDLMIAWICAAGVSCGALGAYIELRDKNKSQDGK